MESDEDYTQHSFSSLHWVNIMGGSCCVLTCVSAFSLHSDAAATRALADPRSAVCFAQCRTDHKGWCEGLIPGPSPPDLGSARPLILPLRYWGFLQSLWAPNISDFRLSLLVRWKPLLKDLPAARSLRINTASCAKPLLDEKGSSPQLPSAEQNGLPALAAAHV